MLALSANQRSRDVSAQSTCADMTAILVTILLCSCQTDTLVVEGENLEYHHSPSLEPCAGTPVFVDGFPPFLMESLDTDLPQPSNLEYRWLDSASYVHESPIDDSEGVARRKIARSRSPALTHELVHTVLNGLGARSGNTFFDEGAAYAYTPLGSSGGYRLLAGNNIEISSRDLMSEIMSRNVEYPVAGSFVGYLIHHHGPAKLLELLQTLGPGLSLAGIKLAFLDVYGVSLESEVERYTSSTPDSVCDDQGFSLAPYECAQESAGSVLSGESWEFVWGNDCADNRSYGGLGAPGGLRGPQVGISVTFDIETAGTYTLEMVSPGPADTAPVGPVVLVGSCMRCPFVQDTRVDNASPVRIIDLTAGKHFIRVSAPAEHSVETGIRIY